MAIVKTYSDRLRVKAILMVNGDWDVNPKNMLERFRDYKSAMDTLQKCKGVDTRIDQQISQAERMYAEVLGVFKYVTTQKVTSPLPQEFVEKLREIEPKLDSVAPTTDKKLLAAGPGPLKFWPSRELAIEHTRELYEQI